MFKAAVLVVLLCLFSQVQAEDQPDLDTTLDATTGQVETAIEDIEAQILDGDEAALIEEELDLIAANGPLFKDVFLVLDNSGSMKKNDPQFLVSEAVREFISQQDEQTRVGIVIFDQPVRLPIPLTEA